MIQELNVGEVITVKSFAFTNKNGGTGLSDWSHNERFSGTATVRIVKRWDDEETGERAISTAVSDDLEKYLDRNAGADRRVFVSEFDIARGTEFEKMKKLSWHRATRAIITLLLAALAATAQAGDRKRHHSEHRESHNYIIERQQAGAVSSGDVPVVRRIRGSREIDVYRDGAMFEKNNMIGVTR
jgi:hypothetical protein